MPGFFPDCDLITTRVNIPLLPRCGQCGLHESCSSPKMPVHGKGKRQVLIVGEGPGRTEDKRGIPFVGDTGRLLRSVLEGIGVNMSRDCWTTNSVICWPWEESMEVEGSRKNRTPTDREISYCRPNLVKTIKELQPDVIIPLGGSAVKSMIGWLWREDVGAIGRWVGWKIPSQKINAWICPTWHPSYINREEGKGREVLDLLWKKHLTAAFEIEGKPWKNIPEYPVTILWNADEAAAFVHSHLEGEIRPVAIDYETDRLKPDSKDSRIVCCSMSDGVTTIAYPWHGKAIRVTQEFLLSDIPKIASNQKFEERWTFKEFGHGVNNWQWDTMLAAHVLDNRPEISSIKFQAFVLLGVDSWDDHIKPFLKSDNSNRENRIREVSLEKLLHYNALDSLYEWKVAKIQQKQLGFKGGYHASTESQDR